MKIKFTNYQINFEVSGNLEGPLVAMSHSLGSSSIMWKTQLPVLEPRYRIVRIDTRGHGRSDAPQGEYVMDDLVADAIAVIDALGVDRFHWVGLSMGGMIGQGLGIHHSDRLLSLSLCDTMAMVPQQIMPVWTERVKTCRERGMESMVESAMERWFTESYRSRPPTREFKEVREQIRSTSVTGFLGCCLAIMNFNYLDQLNSIDAPTQIIVGEQDFATPVSESIAMHERIPNSSLEIIPDAAHFSNIEQSKKFDKSLLSFLAEH